PEIATNGLYHPVTPYARYSGIWTFGDLGADIGWLETSDSQLAFSFAGTQVSMLVRKDNYPAFLYPTVDGQRANDLPADNQGNSYIFLRSASKLPETVLVQVASGLDAGEHNLVAVADRGWDRWALAGYAVSDGDLRAPYDRQIAVASLTFLIALLATIYNLTHLSWHRLVERFSSVAHAVNGINQFVLAVAASLFLMIGLLLTWTDQGPNIFRREAVQTAMAVVLSAGLVALQPGFIISLIALFLLFIIVTRNTQIGIKLIILYAPFFLFPLELYRFSFQMVEIVLWLTFAGWLINQGVSWAKQRQIVADSYRRKLQVKLSAIDMGLVAWIAVAGVSILWADYRTEAIRDLREVFIQPILFYLLLRTSKRDANTVTQWILTFIVSGTIVAVASLLTNYVITAEDGAVRLAGIYGSPNNLALYLLRCIPFALSGAVFLNNRTLRWILAAASIIMIGVVLLTLSVSAYLISLPLIFAILVVARFGRKAVLPLVGLVVVGVVAGVILVQVSPRFASLLDWTQGTNFLRLRVWESAVDMIAARPITGFGLDQFLYAF
ncbi:MAG: O-antigen ligase family protein, partial [Anaerolineae bacterium]|nr:O-antigen ligase family protein [Anaerolineae bacterium]